MTETITGTGIVTAADSANPNVAVTSGPVDITIVLETPAGTTWQANPAGTYPVTSPGCAAAGLGTPFDVSVTSLSGSNSTTGGQVTCGGFSDGDYRRVGTETLASGFFGGTCTVQQPGGGFVTASGVTLTITGVLLPTSCNGGPPTACGPTVDEFVLAGGSV